MYFVLFTFASVFIIIFYVRMFYVMIILSAPSLQIR